MWEHLNFQFGPLRLERNPDSANANLNYRKGVAHTINKDLIVDEILAGQVEPLNSFVAAYSPLLGTGAWEQYDYNVDTAMGYFEDAKAELGVDTLKTVFSTTSNNDARVKLSELFLDMFAAVGVEYENQLEDSQLFFGETLDTGNWDLGEWAWVGTPGFAALIADFDIFDPEGQPPEGSNFYRWGTPDSSVIDDNTAPRRRDPRRAQRHSGRHGPRAVDSRGGEDYRRPGGHHPAVSAACSGGGLGRRDRWVQAQPNGASHTWNIEDWYRTDL